MKNIQVIGKAESGVYDVFGVDEQVFDLIFPNGTDIAFAEDLKRHPAVKRIAAGLEDAWKKRIPKRLVRGIHGTLFYELQQKRQYYPTLRDEEAINPDGSLLRAKWPPQLTTGRESETGYEEGRTSFLNVDFEVISRRPLDALVAALGRNVSVLYQGKWKPGYAAMFEWRSGLNWSADRRIRRFVQAIDKLPRRERRVWDAATARRFDIGIRGGLLTAHVPVAPETIHRGSCQSCRRRDRGERLRTSGAEALTAQRGPQHLHQFHDADERNDEAEGEQYKHPFADPDRPRAQSAGSLQLTTCR